MNPQNNNFLLAPLAKEAGFKTLTAAVEAAGLKETLTDGGPFTVFAPTNSAFAPVDLGAFTSEQLTSILTYHVVPGAVTSDALVGKRLRVGTVQGQNLHVNGRNGVHVNQSRVTTADIMATNGVIHVIDKVLLPK